MASLKLSGHRCAPETQRALMVADLGGIKVNFDEQADSTHTLSIVTREGYALSGSVAVLLYLTRMRPDLGLYGSSFLEMAQVDAIVNIVDMQINIPMMTLACTIGFSEIEKLVPSITTPEEKQKLMARAVADIKAVLLSVFEPRTLVGTFLVGERLTIADICLACLLHRGMIYLPGLLEGLPNVQRWLNLIKGQPWFQKHTAVLAEEKKAATQKKPTGGLQGNQQPKAAAPTPAEIEEQIEAEAKAKAKKANPLDSLPATPMVLDAWKREYSNTKDLKGVAMPYFWKNIDTEGWSAWYLKYDKLDGECSVGYATANMLGGFLQRLDANFRKYSFGVFNVVGEPGNFDIQGVLMIRGQEIPFELKDHPSFDYYQFRKLDWNTAADKELIEAYWCNDDKVEGRPIDSCKVWK